MDNAASPAPKGNIFLAFKNYMFVMGADNVTLQWSALKDITTWPATNTQTITSVADPIVGGAVYGESLLIWTTRRFFRLLGSVFDPSNPTYILQQIAVPPGVYFPFSRAYCIHNGIFKFVAADGVYAYNGGPIIQKISQQIQPDFDAFTLRAQSGEATGWSPRLFVWRDRVWLSLQTTTAGLSLSYLLDERNKWWKWTIRGGVSGASFHDFATGFFGGTGTNKLFGVSSDPTINKYYTLDTGNTDDGTAISGTWTSKEFVFPHETTFTKCYVTMGKQSAGNLTASVSIDRATFIDFTLDMTAGVGTVIRKAFPVARSGKAIRFKVANSTNNQTFEIFKIELEYVVGEASRA